MNVKAILFDLDGTLLDTIADIADSMNRVLDRLGFPEHDLEAYKIFVGEGVETLIRRVLPPGIEDETLVARCLAAMREEYSRRWNNKTRPYPDIPALLDALQGKGIPMAILSNKLHEFTQMMVADLLARWTFGVVLGARDIVPKKPDPFAALEIAEYLKLPPEKFLYLGDTGTDMKTAVNAGMFPVGALWGFRTAQELTTSGARALVGKPLEVLTYL
jgi:phosphoglycolate phosphatase